MTAQQSAFLVLSALFSVTTCLDVNHTQGIVTTLRKHDLMEQLQDLNDNDQVSLNLVQKQNASDTLPPKKIHRPPPAKQFSQPMSPNVSEHILQHTYNTRNATSFTIQSEVQRTPQSEESLINATTGQEDSKEHSKEDPTSATVEVTKTDVKQTTNVRQARKPAFTKAHVKQLLDKGPENVLSYVVIIFAIGALVLSFLNTCGNLLFQYLHFAVAWTGYVGSLLLEGFNTESPKVDRMRKNIPALPALEWPSIPFVAKSDSSPDGSVVLAGRSASHSRKVRTEGTSHPDIVAKATSKGEELKAKMAMLKAALGAV